jgi:hypothetical protein
MDEVPIEFKTYYRVELAGSGDVPAAPADASSEAPAQAPADGGAAEEASAEDVAEPVEAGAKGSGRHGTFARS